MASGFTAQDRLEVNGPVPSSLLSIYILGYPIAPGQQACRGFDGKLGRLFRIFGRPERFAVGQAFHPDHPAIVGAFRLESLTYERFRGE
jgi:hypothetical protein